MAKLGSDLDEKDVNLDTKKAKCIYLLASYLLSNGLESLEDLEATPLELVYGIHKVPFCGCYLPSSMVGVLISVKKYLSLDLAYPSPPPVIDLKRVTLE